MDREFYAQIQRLQGLQTRYQLQARRGEQNPPRKVRRIDTGPLRGQESQPRSGSQENSQRVPAAPRQEEVGTIDFLASLIRESNALFRALFSLHGFLES